MGNFSKSPGTVLAQNQSKGYVGIHIEQGVPVLDRDLNLMHDFLASGVRGLLAKYIGDGAIGGGFQIQATILANNFTINPGTAVVGGIEATLLAKINYSDQPGVPPLTTPISARQDIVFLDVSLSEADSSTDPDLSNSDDVGVQTSVREKVNWVVRVAEGATSAPTPAAGHFNITLARINRSLGIPTIGAAMITDLRKLIIPLVDLTVLVKTLSTYGATGVNIGLI